MSEHAVIVTFQYRSGELEDLHSLEDELTKAIENAGAGEYDGHEIATDLSDGTLYMYGPDADALLSAVTPVLIATPIISSAEVVRRYGEADDPSAREVRSTI